MKSSLADLKLDATPLERKREGRAQGESSVNAAVAAFGPFKSVPSHKIDGIDIGRISGLSDGEDFLVHLERPWGQSKIDGPLRIIWSPNGTKTGLDIREFLIVDRAFRLGSCHHEINIPEKKVRLVQLFKI